MLQRQRVVGTMPNTKDVYFVQLSGENICMFTYYASLRDFLYRIKWFVNFIHITFYKHVKSKIKIKIDNNEYIENKINNSPLFFIIFFIIFFSIEKKTCIPKIGKQVASWCLISGKFHLSLDKKKTIVPP